MLTQNNTPKYIHMNKNAFALSKKQPGVLAMNAAAWGGAAATAMSCSQLLSHWTVRFSHSRTARQGGAKVETAVKWKLSCCSLCWRGGRAAALMDGSNLSDWSRYYHCSSVLARAAARHSGTAAPVLASLPPSLAWLLSDFNSTVFLRFRRQSVAQIIWKFRSARWCGRPQSVPLPFEWAGRADVCGGHCRRVTTVMGDCKLGNTYVSIYTISSNIVSQTRARESLWPASNCFLSICSVLSIWVVDL